MILYSKIIVNMSGPEIIFVNEKGARQVFIDKTDKPRTNVENTLFEMLDQRGYKVLTDNGEILFAKRSLTDSVMVFFEKTSGLTTDRIYKILSKIRENSCNHCIIIYKDGVTTYVRNLIKNELFEKTKTTKDKASYDINEFDIEIFNETEMRFNITRHRLQPKSVERLSDTDALNFKKKYGVKIPVFSLSDPLVRFYNFKKGDIISLVRADGTHTYRIVK